MALGLGCTLVVYARGMRGLHPFLLPKLLHTNSSSFSPKRGCGSEGVNGERVLLTSRDSACADMVLTGGCRVTSEQNSCFSGVGGVLPRSPCALPARVVYYRQQRGVPCNVRGGLRS